MQLLSPPSGATTAGLRRGHTRTPSGVSNISIESEMSVSTTVSDENQGGGSQGGQSGGVKVVLNGDDTASEVRVGELYYG